MPVKKKSTTSSTKRGTSKKSAASTPSHDCCYDRGCGIGMGMNPNAAIQSSGFARKILLTLVGVLLAYVIVFVGTLIRNNIAAYSHIGLADRDERVITVDGYAKVTVAPDIGTTMMGVQSSAPTVAEAQATNTETMNNLIQSLKDLGIADEDIQTQSYDVYPFYDYTSEDGRALEGYDVSQNVEITIRDLEKADDVLALAGVVGANIVSGVTFEIEDPAAFQEEARKMAIKDAFGKAKQLASELGVRLVSVNSFYEYGDDNYERLKYAAYDTATGMGGAAPQIEAGVNDVEVSVSITYEIR